MNFSRPLTFVLASSAFEPLVRVYVELRGFQVRLWSVPAVDNQSMRLLDFMLSAGLLAPATCALAQAGAPPIPAMPASSAASAGVQVSLERVLQAARDNPDVGIARRALDAAAADRTAADRLPTPVLSTKASAIDLEHGVGPGNVLRDKRIDKGLGLDWTLERGDKRALRTRAAERGVDAARLDLAETGLQQQLAAASAFYALLAAQERLVQMQALEQAASELARATQRRLQAGDLSQQEALRTDIEARRAQAELRSARSDLLRAQWALSQVTGLGGALEAVADWPQPAPVLGEAPDPAQRPDVRAAQERVRAAQAALDAAQALRRNDVTVGASIDHIPGTSRRQLELRLQMPLAGVLGTYDYQGEIGRARAALDQAQDQLEKTRRAAQVDADRLLEELRLTASRGLDFHTVIVPRARQVAQMSELAYAKGALPLADLIEARRTLRAVLLDDIAARADHARALAAWQLRQALVTP